LALGEDSRAIKDRLAGLLRQRREEAANLEWEMTGGEVWSFGEIPVEVDGVYPALVDEGETVGMRAFLDPAEAEESHRAGCVRLFLLEQAEQVSFVWKRFPLGIMTKLYVPVLSANGELPRELLECAAEGALRVANRELPRSEEQFAKASKEGKGRLFECAQELSEALELAIDSYRVTSDWMAHHRDDPHLGAVVADLDQQFMWLLRLGFAWKTGFGRLRRFQRFFQAVEERVARLESQPLIRDEEKQKRIQPYWDEWFAVWYEHPDAVRFWELGWMLEEYRMQLFAPGLPREMKVSEKRIEKALEELG
jgi:ATP-dependent helicase HrpA